MTRGLTGNGGGRSAPEPRPTLKTLAEALGLSVTTVSRALKDGDDVSRATIRLVKDKARELGYRPSQRGLSLRTGRTHRICIILPVLTIGDLGDVGFVTLIEGLTLALQNTPYTLAVVPQLPDEDEIKPIAQVVESEMADGIILTRTKPQDERVKYLLERGFPFVTYGRTELFTPYPYLDIDHEAMCQAATERLIGLGHERIALLNPPRDYTYSGHRVLGYRAALRAHGLPFDPPLVQYGEIGARAGRESALTFTAMPEPPTAYVCANSLFVVGLLAGLRSVGVQAGRDVAVIGFDGTEMTGYLDPPVTTYFASLPDSGRRLGELMLAALAGADPRTLQEVWQATLIERQPDTRTKP